MALSSTQPSAVQFWTSVSCATGYGAIQEAIPVAINKHASLFLSFLYKCWICGKAVDLRTCKIDEHGLTVHEDCYAAKLAFDGKSTYAKAGR